MVYKWGSIALIVGSIVTAMAQAVHPTEAPRDAAGFIEYVAESRNWVGIHWAILIGAVLLTGGFAVVYRLLGDAGDRGYALLGLAAALVALAVGTVWVTLEASVAASIAALYGQVGDKAALAANFQPFVWWDFALARVAFLIAWVSVFLYAVAIVAGDAYPRWVGHVGRLLGVVGCGYLLVVGFGRPFQIIGILTTGWTLIVGVYTWRRSLQVRLWVKAADGRG
jgi:hypothetical protein